MTSIFLASCAIVTTYCIGLLIDAGLAYNLFSYSLLAERAMGKKGRIGLDVMISLSQFSFTIAGVIFLIKTLKMTIDQLFEIDSNPWIYGCLVICIYSPVAWERNIAKFSFTYLLGNLLILLAVLYVTVYCFMTMARQEGIAPGVHFINTDSYLSALGMAIYCFEGIGIVMPIMQTCENPTKFKTNLK